MNKKCQEEEEEEEEKRDIYTPCPKGRLVPLKFWNVGVEEKGYVEAYMFKVSVVEYVSGMHMPLFGVLVPVNSLCI